MAFYDKFPYTNFQELNLDWLTQEVSKVRDNRDASDASAAAALDSEKAAKASETAAASSQQAAANSETAAAGSAAESAEYLEQIGTHTAGAVADWLKENLTTTTPPVDASLTVSGAAADAKKTGDAVSSLNNEIVDLKSAISGISEDTINLADVREVEIGVAWNLAANANRAVLYIPVEHSTQYTLSFNDISSFELISWFEKSAKSDTTSLVNTTISNLTTTRTTNASTNFICIQFNKTSVSASDFADLEIQLEKGGIATAYVPHKTAVDLIARESTDLLYPSNGVEVNSLSAGYAPGGIEVTPTKYTMRYLNGNTGKITTTTSDSYWVNKYAVAADKTYFIYGSTKLSNSNNSFAVFETTDMDADPQENVQILIGKEDAGVSKYRELLFTPKYNGYVYIAGYSTNGAMTVAEAIKRVSGMPNGLKIQVFGDSITDDTWGAFKYSYARALKDYLPVEITVTNDGVAGGHLSHGYSSSGGQHSDLTDGNGVVDLIVTDGLLDTSSDVVVILAGTNDYNSSVDIGDWADTSLSLIVPAVKAICEYVTTHSKALLLMCTPLNRYNSSDAERSTNAYGEPINSHGNTLRNYCDAIVNTCHVYGVPVIDTNYGVGFTRQNISRFSEDGLHPNVEGAKILAKFIAGHIREHYGL